MLQVLSVVDLVHCKFLYVAGLTYCWHSILPVAASVRKELAPDGAVRGGRPTPGPAVRDGEVAEAAPDYAGLVSVQGLALAGHEHGGATAHVRRPTRRVHKRAAQRVYHRLVT